MVDNVKLSILLGSEDKLRGSELFDINGIPYLITVFDDRGVHITAAGLNSKFGDDDDLEYSGKY